jgi:hypothetical protein
MRRRSKQTVFSRSGSKRNPPGGAFGSAQHPHVSSYQGGTRRKTREYPSAAASSLTMALQYCFERSLDTERRHTIEARRNRIGTPPVRQTDETRFGRSRLLASNRLRLWHRSCKCHFVFREQEKIRTPPLKISGRVRACKKIDAIVFKVAFLGITRCGQERKPSSK